MSSVQSIPQAGHASDDRLRRFSVDEYHRMISAGVLTDDSGVELLEGRIVQKISRNPPHDVALDQSNEALRKAVSGQWRVRVQSAITLGPDSEPEPDIAVVVGPASRYARQHPGPRDIALAVEVSDTTLAEDRAAKGRIYARAGLPVYWIVNVRDRQIEVYTTPASAEASPAYRDRRDYRAGDLVPLVLFGEQVGSIAAQDMLGLG